MPLYLITSPNGKQYVGITTQNLARRMAGHKVAAAKGSPYPLHAAIRKYGFESMQVNVLHGSRDLEELHQLEIKAISTFGTRSPNGYNLTDGGEGTLGHIVSDEHRKAASDRLKQKWLDADFAELVKVRSIDAAKRMSPEHLEKFIAAGRAYWTPETRAERAEVTRKRQLLAWSNPEYRERTMVAMRDGLRTPEGRAKISDGVRDARAKQTPERRREIAMSGVAAREAKRAEVDALPAEERDAIKAEQRRVKSEATKAGRAAAKLARTPEEQAIISERYRQAALRRTPEHLAKIHEGQLAAWANKKAA